MGLYFPKDNVSFPWKDGENVQERVGKMECGCGKTAAEWRWSFHIKDLWDGANIRFLSGILYESIKPEDKSEVNVFSFQHSI